MAIEVRMGKLSPTMESGTINRWAKKEGEKVSSGDILAEVETDKASMPLEVFEDGTLLKIVAPEGATVKLDELVAVIGAPGEDISALLSGAKSGAAPSAAAAAGKKETADAQRPGAQGAKLSPQHAGTAVAEPPVKAAPSVSAHSSNGGRIKASPLAKKVALERGVDLRSVQPSGPGGRIIQRDIPEAGVVPAAAQTAFGGVGADIPLSNIRQTIARRLLQSKQTIPHWYCHNEVLMDRAMRFREELNANLPEGAAKISVNDLIIKVAAAALARHPEVNAAFNQTHIRRHGDVHIAVAVATEDGLYTPVIRHADRLGFSAISASVRELAKKARDKKLKTEDFSGSGFTISNLGMYGVDHFMAIINPPEAAILAIGAVKNKPVVNDAGAVVAGKVMGLTLSADHRVIDGAVGAQFMGTIRELLEHPAKLLL